MSETLEKPAAGQSAEVLYEVEGGVATITLNRPDRMNAISGPMLMGLGELLLKANADPKVRVVILTGAGRAFCVGLDLVDATRGSGIGSSAQQQNVSVNLDLRNTPPTILFNLDKPTICALNGAAAGYGLDTALGCDIRIMGESAKLAAAFVKRGVVPESGGTWLLPRLVGWSKAAELIFTGRTLSAADSLALGLASEVVPDAELMARARAVAGEIAANAPLAVQSAKRLMRMGMEETFNDHVHHVYLQFLQLIRTQDFKEGMTSFLEKRPADFHGR
ncbi:MAG TPA: enoyl-CoA hydratase-related protein [Phenylobacterium sp.]|jgi:enoyl-CoA hydratase/carnithine racemase|uniref:enoyl-CoA hydratase/isomerase family protein n=1 Tax=Phenylobacterium sp. TaxID=1871053 RepID=UPI002D6766E6|nr:enoyl-CoA hydratase-related protein [Phenylobacterium sp.]HZZ68159.1 enoyl-CoA hydratase-related protein [Phenylobacterium sp.]